MIELVEEGLLSFLEEVFQTIGWGGVVFTMGLESAGIPIPSELIMPLSGWMLIKEKGLGQEYVFLAALYGTIGNLGGSLLAYFIGIYGGRRFLLRYGKYLLITPKELDRLEKWFARYGDYTVFICRMLPAVRTYNGFPAGIARMNIWRFSLFTLVGSYPWCLALAYGGYLLGTYWENISSLLRPLEIPLIVIVVALAIYYFYRQWKEVRLTQQPYSCLSNPYPPAGDNAQYQDTQTADK